MSIWMYEEFDPMKIQLFLGLRCDRIEKQGYDRTTSQIPKTDMNFSVPP